jgi:AraC-like DNA-binding protein
MDRAPICHMDETTTVSIPPLAHLTEWTTLDRMPHATGGRSKAELSTNLAHETTMAHRLSAFRKAGAELIDYGSGYGRYGHLHFAPDIPQPWIVLPDSAVAYLQGNPSFSPLYVTQVGYFPEAKLHRITRPDGTDGDTIFKYCVDGRGFLELGGIRHQVRTGDLLVVPPRVPHSYGSDERRPWTMHWFHARGFQLESLVAELGATVEQPTIRLGLDRHIIALFEELRSGLEEGYAPPLVRYAGQVLGYLFGRMIRRREDNSRDESDAAHRVLQSLRHIKEHLHEPLDVAELSRAAGLSVSRYSALFRELVRSPPKRYIESLRMQRAERLLADTDFNVQSIARMVGYEDPLYFSRTFRRTHEAAPSVFRHRRRIARARTTA